MEYMTIQQFAEDQHVSYEAIRQQVARFHKELDGHIVRRKQQKLLDEYAVNFLRERRRQSPAIVINQDRTETIDALKDELLKAQNMITQLQQQLDDLKDQRRNMIETETRYHMALEQLTQEKELRAQAKEQTEEARAEAAATRQALTVEREKLFEAKAELIVARADNERLEREIGSYHKSIFGFYRKK